MLNESLKQESVTVQLNQLKTDLFTGSLSIQASDGQAWTLYFRLGRLIWQTGGSHSDERWRRHLTQYCPNVTDTELATITPQQEHYREYCILAQLQEKKLIRRQQLVDLINSAITEILFDIIQYTEAEENKNNQAGLLYDTIAGETPSLLLAMVQTEQVLQQARQVWQEWQDAGLATYSPNLFPVIQQLDRLQQHVSADSCRLIISVIDGTRTLRDLALQSNQNVLTLAQFLMPLVQVGAITFLQNLALRKFDLPVISQEVNSPASVVNPSTPLVVCVDDSPVICHSLEEILTKQGYRFIGVQNPLAAISTLIKSKPDFIFLDLLMPIMNGYELCTQIRKTPSLKDVPVVILTGKDGLIDRMRSKLAGSTDFLSKPPEEDKVVDMLHKHLTL